MLGEIPCKNLNQKKIERLTLLKDRYRKLILEPRKEIESEMENDFKDDGELFHISEIDSLNI